MEIIKILAWPVCLTLGMVITVIILASLFRGQIKQWISTVRELKYKDSSVTAGIVPVKQPEPESARQAITAPDNSMAAQFTGAFMADLSASLRKTLDDSKMDPQSREEYLIQNMAASTLASHFERLYRDIYGSQIKALQFLNNVRAKTEHLRIFYDSAKREFPNSHEYSNFESWFSFLLGAGLIRSAAHIEEGLYEITATGKEFMKYLVHHGYPLIKIG